MSDRIESLRLTAALIIFAPIWVPVAALVFIARKIRR